VLDAIFRNKKSSETQTLKEVSMGSDERLWRVHTSAGLKREPVTKGEQAKGSCPNRSNAGPLIRVTTLLTLLLWSGRATPRPSPLEYQFSKLRAESARLEREKEELSRRQEAESLRAVSYNEELSRVLSDFQMHIADQHHQVLSCSKCRQLAKKMTSLSRKIERGVQ
jgi:hypothetical protein